MAASSAAERAAVSPELRHRRGEQVILVFSNQGMGNMVNASVILICMAIFGQTHAKLDYEGSKKVLALTYGIGALMCLVMVVYRSLFLGESEMFVEVGGLQLGAVVLWVLWMCCWESVGISQWQLGWVVFGRQLPGLMQPQCLVFWLGHSLLER